MTCKDRKRKRSGPGLPGEDTAYGLVLAQNPPCYRREIIGAGRVPIRRQRVVPRFPAAGSARPVEKAFLVQFQSRFFSRCFFSILSMNWVLAVYSRWIALSDRFQ